MLGIVSNFSWVDRKLEKLQFSLKMAKAIYLCYWFICWNFYLTLQSVKLSIMKVVFSSQISGRNARKRKCIFFFYVSSSEYGCSCLILHVCSREPPGVVFFPENLVTCVFSLILKLKLKLSLFFPPDLQFCKQRVKKTTKR